MASRRDGRARGQGGDHQPGVRLSPEEDAAARLCPINCSPCDSGESSGSSQSSRSVPSYWRKQKSHGVHRGLCAWGKCRQGEGEDCRGREGQQNAEDEGEEKRESAKGDFPPQMMAGGSSSKNKFLREEESFGVAPDAVEHTKIERTIEIV